MLLLLLLVADELKPATLVASMPHASLDLLWLLLCMLLVVDELNPVARDASMHRWTCAA
jgi:hypothetical protein